MEGAQTTLSPDETVLQESVRARISAAPIAFAAIALPALLFIEFVLTEDVDASRIAVWFVPVFLGMATRTWYSRRTQSRIDELSVSEISRADRWLRISSVINQTLMGMGIWIIQSPTNETLVLPLFVTLLQVLFLLGVMTNLLSDYQTFSISAPLLIGQPVLYWLDEGVLGLAVSVSMLAGLVLMYVQMKHANQVFRDSVLMRSEKDDLLAAVGEEKARAEEALRGAEQINHSKTFIMAAASHDIKQPLFALGMLTDTLLMSDQSEQARSILVKQRRNIDRMSFMFDDLMDLLRFERSAMKLQVFESMTTDLIQTLDDEFLPQCEEKNLIWILDVHEVRVLTDPKLLMRLCRNLLDNALRYTAAGQICCRAVVEGDQLQFEISDTGTGIAPEDQERIFEQFVRLDESASAGAGLGLTIVNYIVQALGYALTLESNVGEGTKYRFGVPLAPKEAANQETN